MQINSDWLKYIVTDIIDFFSIMICIYVLEM